MKTATGLTLLAIGAIFAFAITGHPSWINLQIVGWVIMVTGILGMVLSRRSYGWLRRRMVFGQPDQPAGSTPPAITATVVTDEPGPGSAAPPPPPAAGQAPPGTAPTQEIIEEFRQE